MREVLYILSPSYSGSTLLTFLLASHPEIATVGELKASALGSIETYRCSCGALLEECDFWRQVRLGMHSQKAPFELSNFGTHFSGGSRTFRRLVSMGVNYPLLEPLGGLVMAGVPSYRRTRRAILEQNRRLITLITQLQGGRIFLDGSKDPERLLEFWKSSFWNLKVVRLIRDGRGVANSYMKHYNVPMRIAAREVLKVERACDRVLARVPQAAAMTLNYEDLCTDPQGTVAGIAAWAGLSPDPSTRPSGHRDFHILGNSMRLDFQHSIAIDEKWKRELNSTDLGTFDTVAGNWYRQNGYA